MFMKDIYDKIRNKAAENDGIIRTRDVEEMGINRGYLKDMVDSGSLVRESKGVYTVTSDTPDEYYLIQSRSDKLFFSYGTALFLLGMSDRVPSIIDVTVPQGYNVSRIKKTYPALRFHYVKPEVLLEGVKTVITPQGYQVKVYDEDRCLCDLIKDKKKVDKQLFTQAIKEYFAGSHSARKLLKMARLFGVEEDTRIYMEVL